jgi:hypothetical protein
MFTTRREMAFGISGPQQSQMLIASFDGFMMLIGA